MVDLNQIKKIVGCFLQPTIDKFIKRWYTMGKRKNVATKTFQQGKGFKNDDARSPIVGEPNTNLDFYDKQTGKFVSRRKFDKNGNAEKDLDKQHSTHGNKDHGHDYSGKNRGCERPLNPKEKREINKASKKRRFWRNEK